MGPVWTYVLSVAFVCRVFCVALTLASVVTILNALAECIVFG